MGVSSHAPPREMGVSSHVPPGRWGRGTSSHTPQGGGKGTSRHAPQGDGGQLSRAPGRWGSACTHPQGDGDQLTRPPRKMGRGASSNALPGRWGSACTPPQGGGGQLARDGERDQLSCFAREEGEDRVGCYLRASWAAYPPHPPRTQQAPSRTHLHCSGATGAPEQWKCTFCHLPSRRCHTRVSSDWLVRGRPCPSMYCVRRM